MQTFRKLPTTVPTTKTKHPRSKRIGPIASTAARPSGSVAGLPAPEVEDQRGDFVGRAVESFDGNIGHFLVERRTGAQNLGDLGDRAGARERGPLGAGPQVSLESPGQLGRLGPQPDHEAEVE